MYLIKQQTFLKNDVVITMKEINRLQEEMFLNALKGNFLSGNQKLAEQLKKTITILEGESYLLVLGIETIEETHPKYLVSKAMVESNKFMINLINLIAFLLDNPNASNEHKSPRIFSFQNKNRKKYKLERVLFT